MPDPRDIRTGHIIPSERYSDQPYIVKTDDGAWLCVTTTGSGHEGDRGQHVIATRSTDLGRTWSPPVSIEPSNGPEASYAVLLKTPGGRIYAFYNHNTDRVAEVRCEDGRSFKRVDSLGHYVFKYSDDHGRTWSAKRYDVPIREFACDRENVYGGKLRFFWNVGKPVVLNGAMILPHHKVGAMGTGFFAQSEGVFIRSDNILTETDPDKLRFETLPDGDVGLRAPAGGGRVAEEQSVTVLSDGSLFCVYRTVDGHPAQSYSRDGGRTWTPPEYMTYRPGGRRVKHPRAANFVWRCANGKYLYWFHNHGGRFIREGDLGALPYENRNPAWLAGGVEHDSPAGKVIHWSEPEILLYDDDTFVRMSYPDLVEDQGRCFVTETQKNLARVHPIDSALLEGLWSQEHARDVARDGLLLELRGPAAASVAMPRLPEFICRDHSRADFGTKDLRAGFTVELRVAFDSLDAGQVLLDSRSEGGAGLSLASTERGTLRLTISDGWTECAWECDPGLLTPGRTHHTAVIVDGGPKIISFVVDGMLCDGGEARQFGWGRFSPALRHANGAATLRIAPSLKGRLHLLRIYGRALRTSEAVANGRAEG